MITGFDESGIDKITQHYQLCVPSGHSVNNSIVDFQSTTAHR